MEVRRTITVVVALLVSVAMASSAHASPYEVAAAVQPAEESPYRPGWDEVDPEPQPQPQPQPQAQPAPQPAVQTPPAQSPAPARPPRRRGKGMLIAGWTVFGLFYVFAAINGAVAIDCANNSCKTLLTLDPDEDQADIDDKRRRWGRRMLIPLGGPFAAISVSRTSLAATWAGFVGLAELAGVGLGVAGAVLFARSGRNDVALHLIPTAGGGMLGGSFRI